MTQMLPNFYSPANHFQLPLHKVLKKESEILDRLESTMGSKYFVEKMLEGLDLLTQRFPSLEYSPENSLIVGPVLEGVCEYPLLSRDLKVENIPMWVAGNKH